MIYCSGDYKSPLERKRRRRGYISSPSVFRKYNFKVSRFAVGLEVKKVKMEYLIQKLKE